MAMSVFAISLEKDVVKVGKREGEKVALSFVRS